ncbi:MAG: OmpA family protein, partial [Lachnospiraceae bacterium]|nr:OmpA family protein [Lachnospiraceae bacterium]
SVYKVEQTEETEATEVDTEDDEVVPGNSKSNAYLLPLNTKVFGTVKEDEYAWFSFKTGDDPNATYNATFVNESTFIDKRVTSQRIDGTLMDEYGTEVGSRSSDYAYNDGAPVTITAEKLEPNTTYYMQIKPIEDYDFDYSLIIKNTSDTSSAYKTIGNVSDAIRNTAQDGDTVVTGTNTNINDAVEVPLGAGVHGTMKKSEAAWFSFTTGDQARATYNATFVNDSPKSGRIDGTLMDEYGTEVGSRSSDYAYDDGTPVTITSDELEPNTTYYLQLISIDGYDCDYSVTFKSPDAVAKQSDLIFETPFEINDTQIQFVAESDKFIDEAQAREVLKPVAEAILKHPESSVLLAGTTATDGKQADRVKLSNRRAEAVKKLLVSAYKVPESQLKTVGLGFEADPFERGQDRDASGKFVESEGRKNRRVVVMDAKDPIAQQILGQ